ncbi:FkbM family methyltransferase [Aegicerativicinus sediminis]|uniref:FkbM family methyltransferase n=1 Tax=Aegicerativicinus sediminis TaxID=2893202 RepID=UPI001E4BC2E7|nr:FkbM family methyltransferase [Aegicerativicinus sediminis]
MFSFINRTNRLKFKFELSKGICAILPPIFSQSVRNRIISIKEGEVLKLGFKKRSLTGSCFFGNTSDFHAFKFAIHGYFDWRNIVLAKKLFQIKPGNIIEVGANIGTETISYADITSQLNYKTLAFEPLPSNFSILEKNKVLNKLDNLEIFDCLVSDKNGLINFKIPAGNNSGSGHIVQDTEKTLTDLIKIPVSSLDELIPQENISIIFIDVEGMEFQVIKGALNLIRTNRPSIVLEVNRKFLENRGQTSVSELMQLFNSLSYNCYYINRFSIERVDKKKLKVNKNKNWICIPKEESKTINKLRYSLLKMMVNPFTNFGTIIKASLSKTHL